MDRLELIDRMIISDVGRYKGFPDEAWKHAKEQRMRQSCEELAEDFNRVSRDCHVEYIGAGEFVVTVKAVIPPYLKSKYKLW